MGLRPLALVVLVALSGCYLSHELSDSDASVSSRDAGRRDLGPDLGLRIDAGVPLHPLGELAVGAWRTCGMRHDGSVVCWGDGDVGGVRAGSVPTVVPGITDAVHIATSGTWRFLPDSQIDVCAVRATGGVRCVGTLPCGLADFEPGEAATPFDVPHLDDAVEVAVSAAAGCAVRVSGRVACWGDTAAGQLGFLPMHGERSGFCDPREIPDLDDAVHIAASELGFCAVRRSGAVTCWGENVLPAAVLGVTDAIAVSSGDYCGSPSTCAVRSTGEVVCWGLTFWRGPIDPCNTRAVSPPMTIDGITDAVGIATNGAMLCAVRRSGDVVCTGVERLTGAMGINTPWHDLPEGTPQAVIPPTTMLLPTSDAVFIGVGNTFSCALLSSGEVDCSGANTLGELGDGLVGDSLIPVPVLGL